MSTDYQILEIIDAFDFEKVHRVMELLDWKWSIRKSENGKFEEEVPSLAKLIIQANNLLRRVAEEENPNGTTVSTGGFEAIKDDEGNLGLRFVIADYYV